MNAFPCLAILPVLMLSNALAADPPLAEKRPHSNSVLGFEWNDDFFWLRDREDPKVRAYLEAENAYLESVMAPLRPLRDRLVGELKARIIEDDVSVPYRKGDWLYYSRDVAGKEHSVICRRPFTSADRAELLREPNEGEEKVVLDLNDRAGESRAYTFGGGSVSPDGKLYAWKENYEGTDRYLLFVRNLESGEILAGPIEGSVFDESPVWARDNQTLFFNEGDETDRSWRVRRYRLGDPADKTEIVYEEKDDRFSVSASATKSGKYLLISSGTKDTTETGRLSLEHPDEAPQLFLPRREGMRESFADCGGFWYILTNEGAINGRLMRAPLDQPDRENWTEVLPADEKISYDGIDAFDRHVVLAARKNGVPGFFILDPDKTTPLWITSPTEGGWVSFEASPEPSASSQRFSYETLLAPYTVAEADLASGEIRILKQKESFPGFDPSKYQVERTFATASDGTKLPIWLLLKAGQPRDGSGGILLDGYGAYGIPSDPWFDSDYFSLVDRGVGIAVAQIRGGGEFGRPWYEAGKLANKQTTFTDYIACAEHLIAEKYTSTPRLCGTGASAGGLLAGAVLNRRPDLFGAFIANVPFVDVLNTMLDATLPLTTGEYDEWGDPASSREIFDRIRAYSPYDNVRAQAYPPMLVLAGWNDNRVAYWEPAKWVAKLRLENTGKMPPLLHTEFETGHGGASGRYSALEQTALQYAFILDSLGFANRNP